MAIKKNPGYSILERLFFYLIYPVVYLYMSSLKIEAIIHEDSKDFFKRDRGIFTNYHNHLIPLSFYFRKKGRCVLVSRSRDGKISNFFLKRLGYRIIRGSSSDEGTEVLFSIRKLLREDVMLSLTFDGPRGPKYKMKKGIVWLADRHEYPILMSYAYFSRALRLRSWDGLYVPLPLSRVFIVVAKPYIMEPGLSKEKIEEHKKILEDMMWNNYKVFAGKYRDIYKKEPQNGKEILNEEK